MTGSESRDGGSEGRVARLRGQLARAIVGAGSDGTATVRSALRDYVRAARDAGLGARSVLADVERAWPSGKRSERAALTRDVLEVATLLELGAGDDAPVTTPSR